MHWSEQNEIGLGAECSLYNYHYLWKIIGTTLVLHDLGMQHLAKIFPYL